MRKRLLAVALATAAVMIALPAVAFDRTALDVQVRLTRLHASIGPIDGHWGSNTAQGARAYQQMQQLKTEGTKEQLARSLEELSPEPTLTEYTVSKTDVAGPFVENIPGTLEEMASLPALSYRNVVELLADRFNTDEALLKELNPGKALDRQATVITVPNVSGTRLKSTVARLEVNKTLKIVQAFDQHDKIIASFPATIGSQDNPSPDGRRRVVKISRNPTYTYDPDKLSFKAAKTSTKVTIAPGPNNPVGLVWIALDAPSYGIHGSPDPKMIRRQRSHGCVRLTNWDALQLASAVKPGLPVDFVGD